MNVQAPEEKARGITIATAHGRYLIVLLPCCSLPVVAGLASIAFDSGIGKL